jgi:hypothetical protein
LQAEKYLRYLFYYAYLPMTENDTNISIRTTKRFAAWFLLRAEQENLTASKLGMALISAWIGRGSPMVTEGMHKAPLLWEKSTAWEKLAAKKLPASEPPEATHSRFQKRR